MIEIIAWIFLGCFLGTITGLVPGLHINTVSFLVLLFFFKADINLAVMIVAMAIVHSFVDFIPSILLGAPEEDSFLSILPGHYFLLKGNGLGAIKLTIAGGVFSTIFSILLLPFFIIFVEKLFDFIKIVIPWVLILSIGLMVLTEKEQKKFAIITIIFSAALGLIGLNTHLIQNPLFPLITGFFGASTVIYSMQKKEKIVFQKEKSTKIRPQTVLKGTILSSIASAIVSIIPSIGPSQAAFLLTQLVGKISRAQFLIILGGINTANFLFTFFFLFLTGKTRTGAAIALKELVELNFNTLFLVVCTILIATGIGSLLTEFIGKRAIKIIHLINYRLVNKIVFGFLFTLAFFLSGFFGLVAFLTATFIGLIAITSGVKRTVCMAFLMVPTILYYFQIG